MTIAANVESTKGATMSDLKSYLQGAYNSIHGWVYPGAIAALSACNELSVSIADCSGGACEIGVHHGRFFLALLSCVPAGSKNLAIDVFDMQEFNIDNSGLGVRDKLVENIKKFRGDDKNVSIMMADSLSLTARDVAQIEAECGKFRLFSVDGGHTRIHARHDVLIAEALISNGGLVIVDDFFHPDWPGVTHGLFDYFSHDCAKLAPLCIAGRKLFLTTVNTHSRFVDPLRAKFYSGRSKSPVKLIELFGYKALSFELHPDDPILT